MVPDRLVHAKRRRSRLSTCTFSVESWFVIMVFTARVRQTIGSALLGPAKSISFIQHGETNT